MTDQPNPIDLPHDMSAPGIACRADAAGAEIFECQGVRVLAFTKDQAEATARASMHSRREEPSWFDQAPDFFRVATFA